MKTVCTLVLILVAVLSIAMKAAADDCGGHRCPPPEISTPEPTVVVAPWAPVPPVLLLPFVSK